MYCSGSTYARVALSCRKTTDWASAWHVIAEAGGQVRFGRELNPQAFRQLIST